MANKVTLTIKGGGPTGRTYKLSGRRECVVGRAADCTVHLQGAPEFGTASRHHCVLKIEDDDIRVRDLGSSNGTLINGRRVEAGRLRPGDELSIVHLRYRLEPGPADRGRTAGPQAGTSGDGISSTKLPGTCLFDEW